MLDIMFTSILDKPPNIMDIMFTSMLDKMFTSVLDKPPAYTLLKYLTCFLYLSMIIPYVWPNVNFCFGQVSFNKIIGIFSIKYVSGSINVYQTSTRIVDLISTRFVDLKSTRFVDQTSTRIVDLKSTRFVDQTSTRIVDSEIRGKFPK